MLDATVACRQVRCGSPLNTSNRNHLGPKTDRIWLRVGCSGHEGSLEECLQARPDFNNCSHPEEAAVTCSGEDSHVKIAGPMGAFVGYLKGTSAVF